jgi:hypothetical protein
VEFRCSLHHAFKIKNMKPLFSILLTLSVYSAFSQPLKEKELKTEIKEVTVFLNGAQIFETGSLTIGQGKSMLRVTNLSPYLDEKTIRVKADGDFTILSVNHKLNYLSALKNDVKTDSLTKVSASIDGIIKKETARLEVLKEKQNLLHDNRNLGGQSGASMLQLKQALDFYESEMSKIKDEEMRIANKINDKREEQQKIQQELKELNELHTTPSSEIEITVSADQVVTTKFFVTYLVANAGWYPKYDIRVHDIKSPLDLMYKAEVFQNTGVEWKNVKLRFSNADPNQSGLVPELKPWNLSLARYTVNNNKYFNYGLAQNSGIRNVRGVVLSQEDGQPLPGVNVIVKGTTIGTVTDASGRYNLTLPNDASTLVFSFIGLQTHEVPVTQPEVNVNLQGDYSQLSEVIVTGYSGKAKREVKVRGVGTMSRPIPVTVIENQTTVEIEVTTPYTIKSNGEKLQVDLKNYKIDALYEYFAIPKLDKDAFLVARVINWDQYNLLEGEANLYFEDAFVGRSILDAKSMQDTLDISLGRDKNIQVSREKNEEFSKKRAIGSNIQETRGFKITVRNKKSQPLKLTVFDQIPVSVISEVTVTPGELSGGVLEDKTGQVTWQVNVDRQEQKEIKLQYEVKYPRKEKVLLE